VKTDDVGTAAPGCPAEQASAAPGELVLARTAEGGGAYIRIAQGGIDGGRISE